MSRPFAVFDIDGTLIRWQLYHALADELARRGLLDGRHYQQVRQARMAWKNREEATSFQQYEEALVELIDAALPHIAVADFEQACQQVIEVYKNQVYTYTRGLIAELKEQDYLLFAISASQAEIVGLVAKYYGFDDFGGSQYAVRNGRFTGEKVVLRREKKMEVLRRLIDKYDGDWAHSAAVGDSESDIPMLSAVVEPIAFNPTGQLFAHAKQHGWKVVVERKNVIYQLEPADGSYRLSGDNA